MLLENNQQKAAIHICASSRCYNLDVCRKVLTGRAYFESHASSVGVATRLWDGRLRKRGSFLGRGRKFLCSSERPHQLWDPCSRIFSGYRQLFSHGESAETGKLTTHLHVMQMPRMHGTTPPFCHYFHGVVNSKHGHDHLISLSVRYCDV